MNKTKRMAFGIGIALAVLAAFTAPAMGYGVEGWLDPGDSGGEYGAADVFVYFNFTESVGETTGYQTDIYYDKDCVDIVSVDQSMSPFFYNFHNRFNATYNPGDTSWWPWLSPTSTCVRMLGSRFGTELPPGNYTFAVLRLHCNCSTGCGSDLLQGWTEANNETGQPITCGHKYHNGTYTCTGQAETFEKDLVEGWNLISLSLTPDDNSTSAVLTGTMVYDTVYRYNAASKLFEDVTTGTMDPGTGYFVNVTAAGTWNYSGTAYTSLDIPLKKGLNMIGWLNCSKQISGNLTSIAGKYNYNARWNASYEVYEPQAPDVFNDFEMMERGNGYWIAAKEDCTLTESCSG